jgi:uncharacterized iron-regulated membrane protein
MHLWVGVLFGVYMAVMGITGSALIFRPEIEPRLIPREPRHPVDAPFQHAWDNVRRAYPGQAISTISLNQYPGTSLDDPWRVKLQKDSRTFFVYVDATNGDLLGEQHPVIQWIQELHFKLFAGYAGVLVNAVGALLFVGMCVTGALIWWPGVRNWTQGFKVRWDARWPVVNYDAHHAIGITSALFLAAVSAAAVVSSIEYRAAFHQQEMAWLATVNGWPVDLDTVVARANAAAPGGRGIFLYLPTSASTPFRFDKIVNGVTYRMLIDQRDGHVIGTNPAPKPLLRARVDQWASQVHYGRFGGYLSRGAWVLLGVTVPLLTATGLLMWWLRVVRKKLLRLAA